MDWETFNAQSTNEKIDMLIMALTARFGTLPTEDEVYAFIFGDKDERQRVWNSHV